MNVLVTGIAGYIGSHTAVELLNHGYSVIGIDNLSNSKRESINRIQKITDEEVIFYDNELRDKKKLDEIFNNHDIEAVIHLAGLKAVGESVKNPLLYYSNNLDSTLTLLQSMDEAGVRKLVFSSSATVYDLTQQSPLSENVQTGVNIQNPYGKTKYMIEEILKDICTSNQSWHITALRYFNPIGSHPSGEIGEDPLGIPNNLMPFILQVANKKRPVLKVFGDDYKTVDGTGVRDYIHVVDLAAGHIKALEKLESGFDAINLGTGHGTSVLQMIKVFENTTKQKIPYEIDDRRPGDVAVSFADATKAKDKLGWEAKKSLAEACRDSWLWQTNNPKGY